MKNKKTQITVIISIINLLKQQKLRDGEGKRATNFNFCVSLAQQSKATSNQNESTN